MGYVAIDCLEDAIDATRRFLFPFDKDRWLRLAVVVFFMSGGAGSSSIPSVTGDLPTVGGETDLEIGPIVENGRVELAQIPDIAWAVALALLAGALVLGLVFVLVGSVMEFVLIDALRSEAVTVRVSFRRYVRAGLALFGFRLLLGLIVLIPLGTLGLILFGPVFNGGVPIGVLLGSVAVFVLFAVALALVAALVHGLTVELVVPVMVADECGIFEAWRHLWPTLSANLSEIAVYVVVRWGIAIAVGLVAGTVTGILSLVVLIPLVIFGVGLFVVTGATLSPVAILGFVVLIVVGVLAVIGLATIVQIPLKTGTRYYELLVLGDLDPSFDLVADRRVAIRENS